MEEDILNENVSLNNHEPKHKSWKVIVGGIVALVFFFGVYQVLNYTKFSDEFMNNFDYLEEREESVLYTADMIEAVWYNSIYQISDPETDPYTIVDGYFLDDFNDALAILYSDEVIATDFEKTEEANVVLRKMKNAIKKHPVYTSILFGDGETLVIKTIDLMLDTSNLAINNIGMTYDDFYREYQRIVKELHDCNLEFEALSGE